MTEDWRADHQESRDEVWVFILRICEAGATYEQLDALQDLNDNVFEVLEGVVGAHRELSDSCLGSIAWSPWGVAFLLMLR
jgi:hypothetical protein